MLTMEETKGRRRWDKVKVMNCDVTVDTMNTCFSLLEVVAVW